MENLVSLVGDSGPQPAADWPAAKGYSSPEVKVYGKAVDLTAAGTGPRVKRVSTRFVGSKPDLVVVHDVIGDQDRLRLCLAGSQRLEVARAVGA